MRIKHKKTFEVQSLIISFLVIAFCEAFFLLDVAADILQLDISTSWIDHSLIELITAFSLAPALVIIGLRIKRLLQDHREAQSFVKVASGELLTVIFEKFAESNRTMSKCPISVACLIGNPNCSTRPSLASI